MKQIFKLFITFLVGRRLLLAYIDPNSGGMIFQALAVGLGLLSGFLLFFSGQIKAIWARIMRRQRESGENAIDSASDETEGPDGSSTDQSVE